MPSLYWRPLFPVRVARWHFGCDRDVGRHGAHVLTVRPTYAQVRLTIGQTANENAGVYLVMMLLLLLLVELGHIRTIIEWQSLVANMRQKRPCDDTCRGHQVQGAPVHQLVQLVVGHLGWHVELAYRQITEQARVVSSWTPSGLAR